MPPFYTGTRRRVTGVAREPISYNIRPTTNDAITRMKDRAMDLTGLLNTGRNIRSIGIDDAHYADKSMGSPVKVAGIICAGTRFEGMLWGEVTKDGMLGTDTLIEMLGTSKFAAQIHLVLIDGLTLGGCDVVDLPRIAAAANVPAVAVMRKHPDLDNFRHVVHRLPDAEERWRKVQAAGPIHELNDFVFQVIGEEPKVIARALKKITDQGKVPEPLRLAHLIGSAVMLGQSTNRA